jgi:hypothetical protein
MGELTVNGSAENVLYITAKDITFTGYGNYIGWEVATIKLEKGTNVIQFQSKTNANWNGIEFLSTEHRITNSHINICIVPRIERIKERASTEQSRQ